jgi:ectoine hydroxylase-related dioxygenase (phytanoyl-CoA dioxygenase family)
MSARDLLPGVPLVHSPFFEEVVATSEWDDETRRVATELNRDGFSVIEFQEPELESLAADIKQRVFDPLPWDRWRSGELHELRVPEAWKTNESVRRLAANRHVTDLLSRIYGRRAFPFQTLNFAVGSQQSTHNDLVHFASSPDLFMAGVWLALEDIEEGAGALMYYPGSHMWPAFYNEHVGRTPAATTAPYVDHDRFDRVWSKLRETYGAKPTLFHPRKGQALIWAASLHHGGSPHTDKTKSRMSQVTHYYFEDCAYWTPLMSNSFAGRIAYRTDTKNVATGERVFNAPSGVHLAPRFIQMTAPPVRSEPSPAPGQSYRRPGLARRLLAAVRG